MESEKRREARRNQGRDCDRECCSIKSAEQREVQFLSRKKGIELGVPLSLLLSEQRELQQRRQQVKWYAKATEDGI